MRLIELHESIDKMQKQEDMDRLMAEEIRNQALETVSATQKRNTKGKVEESDTVLSLNVNEEVEMTLLNT